MSEIGEIFKKYGIEYREKHKLPLNQLKVMAAIEKCRTSELGGHILRCEECQKEYIQYNSCRNRHCPTCQNKDVEVWVEKRKEEILPVRYFHIIFTIPAEFNDIFQRNQKMMYDLLFKATSEALMILMNDTRYVGGKAGFMSVLHTWVQNIIEHPHIHTLIPAGALSEDESYWIDSKYEKYLIPVQVLSALFKKKFMAMFDELYLNKEIKMIGKISWLEDVK